MFKINDRVRLKHDNKENPSLTVRSEVGGQRFLCISDCGQRMVWACDHELELVERNADLKQAIREVLLSEQFLRKFAKAFVNTPRPSTIQAWSPITGSESEAYCLQKMERERQAEQSKVTGHFDDTEGVWVDEKSPFDGRRSSDKILEVTVEVTGEVKPPDGWRWLELGEVIREGDRYFDGNKWKDRDWAVKETYSLMHQKTIRRNRFEVGEKVVGGLDNFEFVVVGKHSSLNDVYVVRNKITGTIHNVLDRLLAPYIEDAKPTVEVSVEVTGEVKNPLGCPDGWRILEEGEVIRDGDKPIFPGGEIKELEPAAIGKKHERPCRAYCHYIRRNRFKVGEKVVHGDCKSLSISVVENILGDGWVDLGRDGVATAYHVKDLAPYIEETNEIHD